VTATTAPAAGDPARVEIAPLTPAQERIVAAAQALFEERGVNGTSLQMIADALGVTKAAVYHKFRTKDEIVLATVANEITPLQELLDEADAAADPRSTYEIVVDGLIEHSLSRRNRKMLLRDDPVVVRLLAEHAPFRHLMERMYDALTRDEGIESRVQAVMFTSAMGAAAIHPLVADLDDDTLREELHHFARHLAERPLD
jgi:AcrR family transcriptional regulator